MDRSIKKDITRRYKELEKRFGGSGSGKVSCYVCEKCGLTTKVVEADDGVAPMGIECPYCHGEAMCVNEGDTAPNVSVTHEWYRPTLDEVLAMADGHLFTVNYVLNGGLLRREIRKDC